MMSCQALCLDNKLDIIVILTRKSFLKISEMAIVIIALQNFNRVKAVHYIPVGCVDAGELVVNVVVAVVPVVNDVVPVVVVVNGVDPVVPTVVPEDDIVVPADVIVVPTVVRTI